MNSQCPLYLWKATSERTLLEASFVPTIALSMRNKLCEQKAWNSLNQLISLCDEARRHFETKRFGGLEIDHQLELRRLLDG
jgi:hypothetical protein